MLRSVNPLSVVLAAVVCIPASHAATTESVIYSFPSSATYGFFPEATLAFGAGGTLYGEAEFGGIGGDNGVGVVFKLTPPAGKAKGWTSKLLHEFNGAPDGGFPRGGLVVTSNGTVYGNAFNSGPNQSGTAFQISSSGAFSLLHAFPSSISDGAYPVGLLATDTAGDLFGATSADGPSTGYGTVFELAAPTKARGARAYSTIYAIPLNNSNGEDGATTSGVTMIGGILYGTALTNGTDSAGTVYSLTPPTAGSKKWTAAILYNFNGLGGGAYPFATVVAGPGGSLLGTTMAGGSHSMGIIFQLKPPTQSGKPWTETVLYNFTGAADGANPLGALTPDGNGNYYGTAAGGGKTGTFSCEFFPEPSLPVSGAAGCGTVYKITAPTTGTKWTFSTVYEFAGSGLTGKIKDASNPVGAVILNASGVLFGTATYGGTGISTGAVFQITP